jgi:hypothetical protein
MLLRTFGFYKIAEDMLASQEGLCAMELVRIFRKCSLPAEKEGPRVDPSHHLTPTVALPRHHHSLFLSVRQPHHTAKYCHW